MREAEDLVPAGLPTRTQLSDQTSRFQIGTTSLMRSAAYLLAPNAEPDLGDES